MLFAYYLIMYTSTLHIFVYCSVVINFHNHVVHVRFLSSVQRIENTKCVIMRSSINSVY